MPRLRKTQTSQRVVYTGLDENTGFELIIDKQNGVLRMHWTLASSLVEGKTWQQLVAEIDANNTIVLG